MKKKTTIADKVHEFNFPIKKRIDQNDCCVVLLDIPPGAIDNENVFVFDLRSGNLMWQVSKALVDKYKLGNNEPFVDVSINAEKSITLWSWGGWKVILNATTGEELSYEFTK